MYFECLVSICLFEHAALTDLDCVNCIL